MDKELLKKDFYAYINEKWLAKAKIPNDKSSTGAFNEIHEKNQKLLKSLTKDLIQEYKENKLVDQALINYVEFNLMVTNFQKREELGTKIIKPIINKIESWKSIDDVMDNYTELSLSGFNLPFEFGAMQNFKNSQEYILEFEGPALILPEKSYYDDKNPLKKELLESFRSMSTKILNQYFDKNKSQEIINRALAFDQNLVEYSMSSLEMADYIKMHNPLSIDEFASKTNRFDLKKIIKDLIKQDLKIVNIIYPKFANNLDKVINDTNFEDFKSWSLLLSIISFSKFTNEKNRVLSGEFGRKVTGTAKPKNKNKAAFELAYGLFSMPVGLEFGHRYFGEEAKKDVINKVNKMIEIYEERLSKNEWLSEATKEKAIIKLKKLGVHIGYPNEIKPYYKDLKVKNYDQDGDLVQNILRFNKIISRESLNKIGRPINKELWSMSPATVNAYFNPSMNHIVFPAGILNKPFYSIKQHSSANYGGIGAVIAHEISHAFDNNGANFDENGNLNMWWTEEDFKKFEDKGKAMIELFDGQETEFGKCNGQLTLSENIADGGGISCALAAAKSEDNFDAKEFFTNWAIIWRGLDKEKYAQMLLASDVHAPRKLRANQQVKNLDEFYETFDIKEGDPMYLEPEKRVKIW
ncbi:M13-type metalloendopeptidase [Mycoplasma sp. Mirounga ES2805-ORL]|uniref:M13-type metalloendopeptidase n=1 Tax=Mycoplasma sp. Mirounga ES2805-ORL TaxID=754514 RepID=UPI001F119774|nr:M13-type metalloendopeptidase [Mycoplasma sp. Mirounga ES2805-ORL]